MPIVHPKFQADHHTGDIHLHIPQDRLRYGVPPHLTAASPLGCVLCVSTANTGQSFMQKHVHCGRHVVSPTTSPLLIPQYSTNIHPDFNAGVGLVQMMGKANYVGLVGGGRQPKFAANKVGPPSTLTLIPYSRLVTNTNRSSSSGTTTRARPPSRSAR